MALSVFDMFKISIGPSSSHTAGPMTAAADFVRRARATGSLAASKALGIELYGSLAATGVGHGTPEAVLLGLEGLTPGEAHPEEMFRRTTAALARGTLLLDGTHEIRFSADDIVWLPEVVLAHPNGMRLALRDADDRTILDETYFSVGGGFIERLGAAPRHDEAVALPHRFSTGAGLLEICAATGLDIAGVMAANEAAFRPDCETNDGLLMIWRAMEECAQSGTAREGTLPGSLRVRRRAPEWAARLTELDPDRSQQFWQERVNLVALAVNEENASGGRVVTAPTNGAAGVIPAVLTYALDYSGIDRRDASARDAAVVRFLLTAGAVGILYKTQASISGAEMGCQGEVGSASSMAAAGLAAVLGASPEQVENAAEIAMEHNLGLTCDPIGGLVQIPCIERNAIAAAKAVNAAKMALWGDGTHTVSLDAVIRTMRATGLDMSTKYKETSLGGLAVNVVEC